jgi:RNA-directed DNA polymerase
MPNNNEYYYVRRTRKKKNGGHRVIHAPSDKLKLLQKSLSEWLNVKLSEFFEGAPYITGFLPNKTIMCNAKYHLGKEWVVNLDLEDFFPSTKWYLIAKYLKTELDDFRYIHEVDDINSKNLVCLNKALPQGSPASPIIANYIAAHEIDTRILSILGEDFSYSRYADDITISTNNKMLYPEILEKTNSIIDLVQAKTVYKINKKKIKISNKSRRQEVTGIVVNNENNGIDRYTRNRLRGILHRYKKEGKKLDRALLGKLNFIKDVNNDQYEKLLRSF